MKSYSITTISVVLLCLAVVLVACGGTAEPAPTEIKLAPQSALPEFVRAAPPQVQEAYQFAIANPDVLKKMPCYCGCGGVGHMHNLDCYVAEVAPDGSVTRFDNHAFG